MRVRRWTRVAVLAAALVALAMESSCKDPSGTDATEHATEHVSPKKSPPVPVGAAAFPLVASANGRYMVDQNGAPFFMVGGSPQLLASLSMKDATTYLSTRAAQGFNSMQIYTLPWDFDASHALPAGNGAGYPFLSKLGGGAYSGQPGTADFLTPNPAYFDYLDQILDLATSYGFYIHLYAIDYGFNCDGTQGWWLDVVANPGASLQSFGTFLGNRYKSRTNVIWVDGSDCSRNSDPTNEQKVIRLVAAMQGAGATQLRTGDWAPPSLSTDETLFTPYMQLNGIYSYRASIYTDARRGWNYVPVAASQGNPGAASPPPALPAFLKETDYELSTFSPGDPASIRKLAYWTVLSGGTAGLFFENEAALHGYPGWQNQQLDTPGARDAGRMGQLFQSLAWWKLVPSELSSMRRLITSAAGSQNASPSNYVAAAQASDGSFLLAYVPPTSDGGSQTLTVDLRSMAGPSRARWWDPTSGVFTAIANYPNTGTQTLSTPGTNTSGANDWLLILDVASGIAVTPATASITVGGTVQFAATAYQNGVPVSPQPTFTWSVSGGGSISSTGLFTAGSTPGGPFTVSVTGGSLSGTATVTVTASPVLTSIAVSPASAAVRIAMTQQFTAVARDQFAAALSPQPTFSWTVSGGGTISSSGLFTAGSTTGGPFTVTATSGTVNGTAAVTVTTSTPPIAFVQGAAVDAGVGTVGSLAFGADNTAHNLIIVAVRVGTPSPQVTVTDSRGNSYQLAGAQDQTSDGSRVLIYYASNVAAGASTVRVQLSGSATLRFGVYEYSGVSTLDRVASAQGNTGTSLDTGSPPTTSQSGELVFTLGMTGDPVTYAAGAGYTQRHVVAGKFLTEDRVVSAVGSYHGTATISPTSLWAIVVATFY